MMDNLNIFTIGFTIGLIFLPILGYLYLKLREAREKIRQLEEKKKVVEEQTKIIDNLECKIEGLENYKKDLLFQLQNRQAQKSMKNDQRSWIKKRSFKYDNMKSESKLMNELKFYRNENIDLQEAMGLMRFASKPGRPTVIFTWKGIDYENQSMTEISIDEAKSAFKNFWQEDYSKRISMFENIHPLKYLLNDDEFDIFRIGFHGGSWTNNHPIAVSNLHGFIDFQDLDHYYHFCHRLCTLRVFASPFGYIQQNVQNGWVVKEDEDGYVYLLPAVEVTSQDICSAIDRPFFNAFLCQLEKNLNIVQAVLDEAGAMQWGVVFNKSVGVLQTFIIVPEHKMIIDDICQDHPRKTVNDIQRRKVLFDSVA